MAVAEPGAGVGGDFGVGLRNLAVSDGVVLHGNVFGEKGSNGLLFSKAGARGEGHVLGIFGIVIKVDGGMVVTRLQALVFVIVVTKTVMVRVGGGHFGGSDRGDHGGRRRVGRELGLLMAQRQLSVIARSVWRNGRVGLRI